MGSKTLHAFDRDSAIVGSADARDDDATLADMQRSRHRQGRIVADSANLGALRRVKAAPGLVLPQAGHTSPVTIVLGQ